MTVLIRKVRIENYKSIKNIELELQEYNVLVGYNNAGKSNILNAILWLFGGSKLGHEFYYAPSNPIVVEAELCGVDDSVMDLMVKNQKKALEKYVYNNVLFIRRETDNKDLSVSKIKVLDIKEDGNEWVAGPTGLDAGLKVIFPDPIFVKAMEDAAEDASKFKSGTTIGKLLKTIFDVIEQRHNNAIQKSLIPFNDLFDEASNVRLPELKTFDEDITKSVQQFFPGLRIASDVPLPDFSEVTKTATISIFEDSDANCPRDIRMLGHGAQRSIQMGLIKHLAELKTTADKPSTNTLLFVEEPELYLHPQAISTIRDALQNLSKSGFQVLATTHSPVMIQKKDIPTTIIVRKERRETTVFEKMDKAIKSIDTDVNRQKEILFELSNSSKILFSDKVVLVEGDSEYYLLEYLYEKATGKSLASDKLSLIKVGSAGNIVKAMKVLHAMGIGVKSIVDLDFAFIVGRQQKLIDENDDDYNTCKIIMKELADKSNGHISLSASGWPENSEHYSAEGAFEEFAQIPDAQPHIKKLHEHYLKESIWFWRKGAFEAYTGSSGKKYKDRLNLMNRIDDSDIESVIKNYKEFIECMNWLNL